MTSLIKSLSKPLVLLLFVGVLWSYFQPALKVQLSGVDAKQWSAHDFGKSFYAGAIKALEPRKNKAVKVELKVNFIDLLKKVFPQKKEGGNWKAYAGFTMGVLIPVAFLAAYAHAAAGTAAFFLPLFKRTRFLLRNAFFLSLYALGGVLILRHRAEGLVHEALKESSQGIFGFITKSFVQQISVEPATALMCLPLFAGGMWLTVLLRKK